MPRYRGTRYPFLTNVAALGGGGGGDTTAPVLSNPVDTVTGSTTASLSVDTDEGNGTLYWVVTTSATAPSKAQVKAGQNHLGAAAADSGSQAVSATGAQEITGGASGLASNTAYFAHFMHEDAEGNQSNVVSGDGFTTYDADAQALFDAMDVQPSAARKTLYNTLINDLKAAGVWTKLDIFYILAAHDAQAARLNLKSPGTFTATESVTPPTFETDRGYTGNGTSSRLNTTWVPSTNGVNLVQNDASAWFWSRTDVAGATLSKGSIGNGSNAPFLGVYPWDGAVDRMLYHINTGTAQSTGNFTSTTSLGMFGVSRTASALSKGWRNGAQLGSNSTVVSTGRPTEEQWICAVNASSFDTRQMAMAAWGASLAGLEASFYNAVSAYLQGVGAAP
jgi:hypothetical protein